MNSSDLTFVIQGPVYSKYRSDILVSEIALNFPGSKIIFSTWTDQDVSDIIERVDILILSEDPGGIIAMDSSQSPNNVNRQIVSTLAGLKKVSTKYAVKLRSDMTIENDFILKALESRPMKTDVTDFDLTKEYVLVTDVTSINPKINMVLPHHPGDWFYAGLTEDLVNVWDIPLMPNSWFRYFENNSWPAEIWYETNYLSRFRAESYIWSTFARKSLDFVFENCFDTQDGNIELSENLFASNLMILNMKDLGVGSRKHRISILTLRPCYTYVEWRRLCLKAGRQVDISTGQVMHHLVVTFLRNVSPVIDGWRRVYFHALEIAPIGLKRKIKQILLALGLGR